MAIKDLRKQLVEIDAGVFTAKAQNVSALYPAQGIYEVVIILSLGLISWRCGANLNSRTPQRELVNRIRDAVGGAIQTQVRSRDRRYVSQRIVDSNKAETEIIDQRRRQHMRLVKAKKTSIDRQVVRKVQVSGTDAALQCPAQ